jgi:hypothetical protein
MECSLEQLSIAAIHITVVLGENGLTALNTR